MLRGSSARKLKSERMSAHQSAEEVFPPGNAETELIERCRASDEDAWDALFDKYYAAVARFVFQLSTDFSHEDTEEICQETFLSVVRNLESFHGKSSFQTWLFRIATNKAMDFRQKMHAAKRGGNAIHLSLHAGADYDDPPVDPPSLRLTPDALLQNAETCHLVRRSLDQLDESCRVSGPSRHHCERNFSAGTSVPRLIY